MATHPSILARIISWIEEPGRVLSLGSQRVDTTESDWACTHARVHMTFLVINAMDSFFSLFHLISLGHLVQLIISILEILVLPPPETLLSASRMIPLFSVCSLYVISNFC